MKNENDFKVKAKNKDYSAFKELYQDIKFTANKFIEVALIPILVFFGFILMLALMTLPIWFSAIQDHIKLEGNKKLIIKCYSQTASIKDITDICAVNNYEVGSLSFTDCFDKYMAINKGVDD